MKNSKKIYGIDGFFLTQQISGIQRYAFEIICELDKIVEPGECEIIVPEYAVSLPEYENIRIVRCGRSRGIAWEQTDLPGYLRKNKREGIFLTNVIPLTYSRGIVVIYDVACRACPQFFRSLRGRLSAFWHRVLYRKACGSDMKIVTVSEFSKSEICRFYGTDPNRITVIYSGWQHMDRIKPSADALGRYGLKPQEYFFSMSRLDGNKNIEAVVKLAEENPDGIYAIAGSGRLKFGKPDNVRLLGYVSDSDAKRLLKECRAFIFMSHYEGFGIPPLEALACGCEKVIISDIPVFREIYGPDIRDIDRTAVLKKYSWKKSAKQLKELMDGNL